jgi:hypothetical protein
MFEAQWLYEVSLKVIEGSEHHIMYWLRQSTVYVDLYWQNSQYS